MPRVPTYDTFQTTPTVGPSVQFAAPATPDVAGAQAARFNENLNSTISTVSKIATEMQMQANAARVDDGLNQIKETALTLTYDPKEGFLTQRGSQVMERQSGKPLGVEYTERLQERVQKIAEKLPNEAAKRDFLLRANDMVTSFRGRAQEHELQEFKTYQLSTQSGKAKVAADAIALNPLDTRSVRQNLADIEAATYGEGKLRGMAADDIKATILDRTSAAHKGALSALLTQQNTDAALAYYQEHKGGMSALDRAAMEEKLGKANAAKEGVAGADDIFTRLGPKADGEPVQIDVMEREAREKYGDKPETLKAVIGELRDRAQSFNAAEAERHASNTSTVFKLLDNGLSLNQVRQRPEWLALPGKEQHAIVQSLESDAYTREARAAARANRAASESQRALSEMERNDRLSLRMNAGDYLHDTDPQRLSKMSRAQVEALRAKYGFDATQHLLGRWDSLQSKEGVVAATVDQQDFEHVARQMGLKPGDRSPTEKQKLGEMQYRIENLIDIAQSRKGGALTRQEKMELMRQEMARKIEVADGWFGGTSSKPLIQATPNDLKKVVVPKNERAQIVEALKTMYQRSPNNPAFAPTEENVKRLYLKGRGAATYSVINDAQ